MAATGNDEVPVIDEPIAGAPGVGEVGEGAPLLDEPVVEEQVEMQESARHFVEADGGTQSAEDRWTFVTRRHHAMTRQLSLVALVLAVASCGPHGSYVEDDVVRLDAIRGATCRVSPADVATGENAGRRLESRNVGRVRIYDDFSVVELPDSMPKEVFRHLKTVWVCGQKLRISVDKKGGRGARRPPAGRGKTKR